MQRDPLSCTVCLIVHLWRQQGALDALALRAFSYRRAGGKVAWIIFSQVNKICLLTVWGSGKGF